jgi:hypothetical protein
VRTATVIEREAGLLQSAAQTLDSN